MCPWSHLLGVWGELPELTTNLLFRAGELAKLVFFAC
jgi:hypothetical protein